MKTSHPFLVATTLVIIAFGGLSPVEAVARERSTTIHTARGATYQKQFKKTPGHFSASGSATLPNGKTASRNLTTQKTEMGRTTNAQATGFNGRSATYNSSRTRTDNGYVRQAQVVGPNGATGSKQVNVSKQNGVVTRSVITTTTPPNP